MSKDFLYQKQSEATPAELIREDILLLGKEYVHVMDDMEFLLRYGITKSFYREQVNSYELITIDRNEKPEPFTEGMLKTMVEGVKAEGVKHVSTPKVTKKTNKKKPGAGMPEVRTSVRPSQQKKKQGKAATAKATPTPRPSARPKPAGSDQLVKKQDEAGRLKKEFRVYKSQLLRQSRGKFARASVSLAEKAMKRDIGAQGVVWGSSQWLTIVHKYFPGAPFSVNGEEGGAQNAAMPPAAEVGQETNAAATQSAAVADSTDAAETTANAPAAATTDASKATTETAKAAAQQTVSKKAETPAQAASKKATGDSGKATANAADPATSQPATAAAPQEGGKAAAADKAPVAAQDKKAAKKELSAKDKQKLVDAGSDGLIKSFSTTAPTQLLDTYNAGTKVSEEILKKEAKKANEAMPKMQAPTGIDAAADQAVSEDARPKAAKAPDAMPSQNLADKSETEQTAAFQERFRGVEEAFNQRQEFGRDPEVAVDPETGVDESAAESAIDNIAIDVNKVPAEMGPAPDVELSGATDPAQMQADQSQAEQEAAQAQVEAQSYTQNDFGESTIYPEKDETILEASRQIEGISATAEEHPIDTQEVPAELVAETDKLLGSKMLPEIQAKQGEFQAAGQEYETGTAQAHADSEKEIEGLQQEAATQQLAEKARVNAEIEQNKAEYRQEVEKLDQQFQEDIAKGSADTDSQISSEKEKGDREAQQHFADAEKKADKEKAKAEREAEKKKDEKKKEKKGFWGSIASAVSSVIDAVKDAVNSIFEGLKALVKGIFDAAKKLAMAAIDLACKAITSLIKVFGELVKGLITVLLAAFPELQKKLLDKVNNFVNAAVEKVNQLAEGLKNAVAKALDFLASVIDTLLNFVQQAYNIAFTAIGMIVKGEFAELGKYLAKSAINLVVGTMKSFLDLLGIDTSVLDLILDDPIQFFKNLIAAVKGGVNNFVTNIKKHLMNGLAGWLFGTLGGAGITLPQSFDLKGIIFLVLQILNLTWDAMKARIAKMIGPKGEAVMEKAEQVAGLVKDVVTNGPMAIVDRIKEYVSDLKETLFGSIIEWVRNTIIVKAVAKLVASLNPAGAILAAIQGIYNTVMFFIERWDQIKAFCQAVMNSIKAVATGNIDGAKGWIEDSLGKAIPVTLGFLARLIGLGGIAEKIRKVIKKIRKPIDKAINKVVGGVARKLKSMAGKLFGKGKKGKDGKDNKDQKDNKDDKNKNADQEVGELVKFSAKDGGHKLYVKTQGKKAKLIVHSVEGEVHDKLKNWEKQLKGKEWDDGRRKTVKDRVNLNIQRVRDNLSTLDSDLLRIMKMDKGSEEFAKLDKKIEKRQQLISSALKHLFNDMGDEDKKDLKVVYAANLKQVHNAASDDVLDAVDKISEKVSDTTSIKAFSGLEKQIKQEEPAKPIFDNPLDTGHEYGGHVDKQIERVGKDQLKEKYTDDKKTEAKDKISSGTHAHNELKKQIMDKLNEKQADEKIKNVFTGDAEHTKFKPIIKPGYPKKDKPAKGKSTLVYTYEGGDQEFTSIYDSATGIPEEITGEKLELHEFGRGVTQGETHEMHDRAHLIANMLMGSGYKTAKNLVVTSSTYNQVDMKKEEERLYKRLSKVQGLVSFKLNVKVSFAEPGKDATLREIKRGIASRLRYLADKSGTKIDKEKGTLTALQKLSDDELKGKIAANIAAKKQARCMKVLYTVIDTQVLNSETNKVETISDPGITGKLGPDLLYGTA